MLILQGTGGRSKIVEVLNIASDCFVVCMDQNSEHSFSSCMVAELPKIMQTSDMEEFKQSIQDELEALSNVQDYVVFYTQYNRMDIRTRFLERFAENLSQQFTGTIFIMCVR